MFSIGRVKKLLSNHQQIIEDTLEFIRAVLYNGNKKESYVNTRVRLYKGLRQKSSLTLPPDPDTVTQAIKRLNPQIKIWLQSLNQNMTLLSFEQNGWK